MLRNQCEQHSDGTGEPTTTRLRGKREEKCMEEYFLLLSVMYGKYI
jgi:hypothetical protein